MYDAQPKITEFADQILKLTEEAESPRILACIVDVVLWKLRRQNRNVEHDAIVQELECEMKYAREKLQKPTSDAVQNPV